MTVSTLYSLVRDCSYIIIPLIQRDYAQGRESEEDVRMNFLKALKVYIQDGKSHSLDFVYGNKDGNKFIPIDGQQRLTTLFLLSWYLAVIGKKYREFQKTFKDVKSGRSKFRYETRTTSAEFCDRLVSFNENPDIPTNKSISEFIEDMPWFHILWKDDPSISSMLVMLDAIDKVFGRTASGYWDRLIDEDNPPICFSLLLLEDIGLSDDIYIKMNSRSLELTDAEILKVRLSEKMGSRADEFKNLWNDKWIAYFWNFFKEKRDMEIAEDIDESIVRFIYNLAVSWLVSETERMEEKQTSSLFAYATAPKWELFETNDSKLRNGGFYAFLVEVMYFISGSKSHEIALLPEFSFYYSSEKAFEKLFINKPVNNNAEYLERARYYVYLLYRMKHPEDAEGLSMLMRIYRNLSSNMIVNSADIAAGIFRGVTRFLKMIDAHSCNVFEALCSDPKDNLGFTDYFVKDERIKSVLFRSSENWKNEIINAERNDYFGGQLISVFLYTGIEKAYDEGCLDPSSCFADFQEGWRKISSLFDNKGLRDSLEDKHELFRRALLSKGNYLVSYKWNLSFLIDSDRDIGWKRAFAGRKDRERSFECIRALLDDPDFNPDSVEESLDTIIGKAKESISDWRAFFINEPELFERDYIGHTSRCIRPFSDFSAIDGNMKILLLEKVRVSGTYSEVHSLSFFLENKAKIVSGYEDRLKIEYIRVSGAENDPCILIEKKHEERPDLTLNVSYQCDYENPKARWKLRIFHRERKLEVADERYLALGFSFDSDKCEHVRIIPYDDNAVDSIREAVEVLAEGDIH